MTAHLTEPERRKQILDAAKHLFTTLGFEQTSVEQIALEAGLSKGAVYWYFEGKLQIILELCRDTMDDDVSVLERIAHSRSFGAEAFYKVHREFYRERLSNPLRGRLLSELVGLSGRYVEVRDLLTNFNKRWDEVATVLINEAVETGVFRRVDSLIIARAVGAMYQGLSERRVFEADIDLVETIEVVTRLLYDALITQQPEIAH